MHADPHALGLRIAGLRRAQGWSQRRLAEAAGVSHGYVALLELGRLPSPGKFRLDAVAHALNLRTSDALLGQQATTIGRQALLTVQPMCSAVWISSARRARGRCPSSAGARAATHATARARPTLTT